jgi:phage-related protein
MLPHPRHPKLECSFYKTDAGREPVRDWLKGMDDDTRRQIGEDIGIVQWTWPVGRPLVGSFGGGLHEVRTTHGRNEYRVLFCVENDRMILLNGLRKQTQRTPPAEIALARKRQKG